MWIWDPLADPQGLGEGTGWWFRQPPMEEGRYYPTVVQMGEHGLPEGELIVAGGWPHGPAITQASEGHKTYRIFQPSADRVGNPTGGTWVENGVGTGNFLFDGPDFDPGTVHEEFNLYPRLFLLPDGTYGFAGPGQPQFLQGAISSHGVMASSGVMTWTQRGSVPNLGKLSYGPVLLYPNVGPLYVSFRAPAGPPSTIRSIPPERAAPYGHYMAFLLNNAGIPSEAQIISFQFQ